MQTPHLKATSHQEIALFIAASQTLFHRYPLKQFLIQNKIPLYCGIQIAEIWMDISDFCAFISLGPNENQCFPREWKRGTEADTETETEGIKYVYTGISRLLTPNLYLTDVNEIIIPVAISLSLKRDHLTGERRAAGYIDLLRQIVREVRKTVTQPTVHEHLASCHTVCEICMKQSCFYYLQIECRWQS